MIRVVLRSSDNIVHVTGVTDVLTDLYISTATVWISIFDSEGDNVDGVVWPVTLDYVTGSNGDYNGLIPDAVEFVLGDFYTARITVDDGPGRKVVEDHELEIVERLP